MLTSYWLAVLSDKLIAAYMVEDASIDPFKLSLENISQAQELGSILLRFTKVVGFEKSRNKIIATRLQNTVGWNLTEGHRPKQQRSTDRQHALPRWRRRSW